MGINAKQSLRGALSSSQTLDGKVVGTLEIVGKMNVGGQAEVYEGDYEVIPKVTAQSLPTKEKYMIDDVTVKEIPFFETSNNSGGNTVYIGGLDEITIQ